MPGTGSWPRPRSRATSRPRPGRPSSAATAGRALRVAADAPAGPVGGQILVQRPARAAVGHGLPAARSGHGRRRPGRASRWVRSRAGSVTRRRGARLGWVRMEPEAADTPEPARGAGGSRAGSPAPHVQPERTLHHRPGPGRGGASSPGCTASAASRSASRSGWASGSSRPTRSGWRSSTPSTPTRCAVRASPPAPSGPTGTCGRSWRRGAWPGCCSRRTARHGHAPSRPCSWSRAGRGSSTCTAARPRRAAGCAPTTCSSGRRSGARATAGFREYDLWGLPRAGIAQFKSGFGGTRDRLRRCLGPGHATGSATGCCGPGELGRAALPAMALSRRPPPGRARSGRGAWLDREPRPGSPAGRGDRSRDRGPPAPAPATTLLEEQHIEAGEQQAADGRGQRARPR